MVHPGDLLFNCWLCFGMILNIMATGACKTSSFSFWLFPFLTTAMSTASSRAKGIRHLLTIAVEKMEKLTVEMIEIKKFCFGIELIVNSNYFLLGIEVEIHEMTLYILNVIKLLKINLFQPVTHYIQAKIYS